jgi:glycosyltransferase 2 family protein
MRSKLLSVLKYFLLLAVAGVLLYFSFRGISIRKVFSEMLSANIFWVLLSFLMSLIALVSRAYRWNLLLEPLGYSPRLINTTSAVSIGYFANLAFPRLGEVTRCATLSKAESIPFSSLLGTVIVERIIDVITLFLCLVLTAIIEFNRLGNFLNENIFNPIGEKLRQFLTSTLGVAAVVIFIAVLVIGLIYFRKKQKQKGRESIVAHFVKELLNGLRSVTKLKRPWLFVFHSIFIWVLYFLSAYICFFALPATSGLGLSAGLFILTLGGLGMSAPVQGGIGVYHLLVSQGLMLYGLSQQAGLAFATLLHSLQIVMVVSLGSVSLFLLFLQKKKRGS